MIYWGKRRLCGVNDPEFNGFARAIGIRNFSMLELIKGSEEMVFWGSMIRLVFGCQTRELLLGLL